jgi:DNA-binding MarR family transcriptional regulator
VRHASDPCYITCMPQATTSPTSGREGVGERPADELVLALGALVTHLKRKAGDPDTSARAFLLGHVDRLAPVRATDLADHAALDLSTISRHLRGLEDAGLLTRSPDPDDRRASLLSVTDEGRAFVEDAVRARTAMLAAATADWPASDVSTLSALITRLAHDLESL